MITELFHKEKHWKRPNAKMMIAAAPTNTQLPGPNMVIPLNILQKTCKVMSIPIAFNL
jgi:hypothetical protein